MILFVMAGHAMELAQESAPVLWIGTGFRMPLMIGLSGYLLNVPRARSTGTGAFIGRHAERMLLPWLVALFVCHAASGGGLGWTMALDFVLRPPFHLWYVPTLFFLILATRLLPFPPMLLLAISAPFSLATMYVLGTDHRPIGEGSLAPDSRFLLYPLFFFFGMAIAERRLSGHALWVPLVLAGLGTLWWASLYGATAGLAHVPARLLMCLGLIALMPAFARLPLRFGPLNHVGRESLFFYLWHPMAMGLMMAFGSGAVIAFLFSLVLLYAVSALPGEGLALRLLKGHVRPSTRHRPEPAASRLAAHI